MRHATLAVFAVDFDGGEYVYQVHPLNVQLVTDSVIMPVKEEHGCDSGSENLDKHEPRDVTSCIFVLKDVVTLSLFQKGQNDRIKNIVSVSYGIQRSLNNFELGATIMTKSFPVHNSSASPKTVGLVHTRVRKKFPTPAVHTITSIAKTKCNSGFTPTKDVFPGVKLPTTACTSPG
jgi:ribosome-binding ATPase YchF (GTP1/OBG family)